jgi:hypothetical protein
VIRAFQEVPAPPSPFFPLQPKFKDYTMLVHMKGLLGVLLALVMFTVSTSRAWAIWAPVPLEILVDESYVIVEGKVSKIEKAGFAINNRNQDVAIIEVTNVLKALPHLNKPKQIRLLQPAAGGIAVSTDLRSNVGQTGIWLLAKHLERDGYIVKHPSQFQPLEEKQKLTELIASREKLAGGKPVKGLQARAELFENAVAGGPTFYEVRLSVKNVSDKPLQLFNFAGAHPLVVDWTGPAGEKLTSKHYDWLKRADLAAANDSNIITLPPGGVQFIGPQSRDSGVYFQSPSDRPAVNENEADVGTHKIVLSYANTDPEPVPGTMDVWQGTVTASEITITAK